ncbi:dynein associated protein-domain-containing protein [Lentinula detonsa]|uniref:Dynein associated protein-domain-containing protein n=1 Tax=Lentinula detonsa TaxID=2804962 RepID=A0A9W8TVH1_9AGAR|nr:dynein associated protein-domain-containing protein [Lentinula detonsa]
MNSSSAALSSIPDPPLGAIVELSSGIGTGVIRFNGYTDFKPGKWIGVELFEQNGKNDGSVGGVRYFSCKGGMGYGVFVRASQIKKIIGNERENSAKERRSSVATTAGTAGPSMPARVPRPNLGHQRTSSFGNGLSTAPSSSLRVSPASVSSGSRSASPAKPSSSVARLTQPSPTKKSSLSSSTTTATRPGHQSRRSISLKQLPQSSSPNPPRVSSPLVKTPSPVPPPVASPSAITTAASILEPSSLAPEVAAPPPPPPPPPTIPTNIPDTHPQIHALLTKIRVLETNRSLDRLQIQSLESKLSESASFLSLRPKLQAKLQSQQTEITSLKQEINESRAEVKLWEERKDVVESELEMCMLDKEMAEERAEIAHGELEAVKEKLAEAEVEVEVLREEKELWQLEQEDGESQSTTTTIKSEGGKPKDTLAYIQLEKQNERLKEALLRLRDMTQETDQDQRRRIAEMEKDLATFEDLQSQLSTTAVKLTNAETQIEDLKLQLDDALGAEDILVQLTERNLVLGEKIEEMRITIEDLEALKELSDELEENHLETEKALQADIENLTTQLASSQLKIATLSDSCVDYEGTIGQFRDLVLQLQGELHSLRLTTASAESERGEALSQTAAILSANIRLQSSASKARAREVEVELGRMRERELREELEIVEGFLPAVYSEGVPVDGVDVSGGSVGGGDAHGDAGGQSVGSGSGGQSREGVLVPGNDRDALHVYMFFQRIASKADIINNVVAQTHGLPDALDLGGPDVEEANGSGGKVEGKGVTELLVGVCEMRGRLSVLSTLCKRLSAILRRCSPELWISAGRLYHELKPLEKRMDIHVDLLRRDEFRERECVSDIIKLNSQFSHLAEVYFGDYFNGQFSGYDIAERELGTLTLFDLDLDMFAASIGMMKTSVQSLLKDDEFVSDADFGGFDIQSELYTPLLTLLSRSKAAKTSARKMAKKLEELASSSSSTTPSSSGASAALKAHLLPQMDALSNTVQDLVNFGISLAQQTLPYLTDVRAAKTPFKLTTILGFAKQQASQINISSSSSSTKPTFKPGTLWWEVVGDMITHLIQDSARLLPLTLDPSNVLLLTSATSTSSNNSSNPSSSFTPPWISRIQTVHSLLSASLSSVYTHRISTLTSDLLSLSRTLKAKDQHLAELNVKVELLERRAEGKGEEVKRMEGVVKEMEGEVGRLRKVEGGYEEAMEQMQAEVEGLEREVAKLRTLVGGVNGGVAGLGSATGAGGEQTKGGEQEGGIGPLLSAGVTAEVSMDHAQLLDQYTAMRNTVRFLRTENAYLRGHDLIREIQSLPVLPEPRQYRPPTPSLDPSGLSDTDTEADADTDEMDDEIQNSDEVLLRRKTNPSLEASSSSTHRRPRKSNLPLLAETKLLYRSVMRYSSSPLVVDLSEVNMRRLEVSQRRGFGRNHRTRMEESQVDVQGTEGTTENGVLEGQGNRDETGETVHVTAKNISDTGSEVPPRLGGVWMPRKKMPAHQLLERRMRGEKLGERVRELVSRVERVSVVRIGGVKA